MLQKILCQDCTGENKFWHMTLRYKTSMLWQQSFLFLSTWSASSEIAAIFHKRRLRLHCQYIVQGKDETVPASFFLNWCLGNPKVCLLSVPNAPPLIQWLRCLFRSFHRTNIRVRYENWYQMLEKTHDAHHILFRTVLVIHA